MAAVGPCVALRWLGGPGRGAPRGCVLVRPGTPCAVLVWSPEFVRGPQSLQNGLMSTRIFKLGFSFSFCDLTVYKMLVVFVSLGRHHRIPQAGHREGSGDPRGSPIDRGSGCFGSWPGAQTAAPFLTRSGSRGQSRSLGSPSLRTETLPHRGHPEATFDLRFFAPPPNPATAGG